jgi:hypothetical protein
MSMVYSAAVAPLSSRADLLQGTREAITGAAQREQTATFLVSRAPCKDKREEVTRAIVSPSNGRIKFASTMEQVAQAPFPGYRKITRRSLTK